MYIEWLFYYVLAGAWLQTINNTVVTMENLHSVVTDLTTQKVRGMDYYNSYRSLLDLFHNRFSNGDLDISTNIYKYGMCV